MKLIPLSIHSKINAGKFFAMVDDDMYDYLIHWDWSARLDSKNGNYYATRKFQIGKKRHVLQMHRFILGVTDGNIKVDHIDHNGLNNQISNIRECTHKQNMANVLSQKGSTSIYKGVSWKAKNKAWIVQITVEKKPVHIGCFKSELEAAKAYDIVAKKVYGEFAFLNFKSQSL